MVYVHSSNCMVWPFFVPCCQFLGEAVEQLLGNIQSCHSNVAATNESKENTFKCIDEGDLVIGRCSPAKLFTFWRFSYFHLGNVIISQNLLACGALARSKAVGCVRTSISFTPRSSITAQKLSCYSVDLYFSDFGGVHQLFKAGEGEPQSNPSNSFCAAI